MKAAVLALLALLVLLQGTWLPNVRVFGVMPDAVLLAITSWAVLLGGVAVVPVAAVAGVALDVVAGTPLGQSAAALLVAVLATGWWRGTILYRGIGIYVVAAGVATLAYDGTLLVAMQTFHQLVNWPVALRAVIAPSAVLNGILAIPTGYGCAWLARRLGLLHTVAAARA